MREVERNVMCVLLQRLLDRKLITTNLFEDARVKLLTVLEEPEIFCCEDGGNCHGHTQNPC